MRHGKKFNHLGRKPAHRKAVLRNMANSLIAHKRISTTLAKAKEIRSFLEPLVTLAKLNNLSNQRKAFSKLQNKGAVAKLFSKLGPRYKERPGGYLRIIKRGYRGGDKAPIAQVEFVIDEDNKEENEDTKGVNS